MCDTVSAICAHSLIFYFNHFSVTSDLHISLLSFIIHFIRCFVTLPLSLFHHLHSVQFTAFVFISVPSPYSHIHYGYGCITIFISIQCALTFAVSWRSIFTNNLMLKHIHGIANQFVLHNVHHELALSVLYPPTALPHSLMSLSLSLSVSTSFSICFIFIWTKHCLQWLHVGFCLLCFTEE